MKYKSLIISIIIGAALGVLISFMKHQNAILGIVFSALIAIIPFAMVLFNLLRRQKTLSHDSPVESDVELRKRWWNMLFIPLTAFLILGAYLKANHLPFALLSLIVAIIVFARSIAHHINKK